MRLCLLSDLESSPCFSTGLSVIDLEMEPGKLFIGGISWDTNDDRLREYFQTFGDVVEAVIMKDRTTGRARGFGFVIFADPAVAERVVKQKHVLDGRTVEAKKAVPRDDSNVPFKSNSSMHGSPVRCRTKKIFVGGLPSSITESDFKRYFDLFGVITDVVVMYDHNTQRPRGFGFITYDSEDAVERALVKTFHELNGKMVEVKQAVPKESSPGFSRSPFNGSNFGMNRVSSLINLGMQVYSPSLVGGSGVRMDDRPNPLPVVRTALPSMGASGFGTTLNTESRMNGEIGNFISNFCHDWGPNAPYRRSSFSDYAGIGEDNGLTSNSMRWSLWGKGSSSNATYAQDSSSLLGFKNGDNGVGPFTGPESIWDSYSARAQPKGNDSFHTYGNLSYVRGDINLSSRGEGNNKNGNGMPIESSYAALSGDQEANFDKFFGNNDEIAWASSSSGFKGSDPFEFGLGNATSDHLHKNPALCW